MSDGLNDTKYGVDEPTCPSCGVALADHIGTIKLCQNVIDLQAETGHLQNELSNERASGGQIISELRKQLAEVQNARRRCEEFLAGTEIELRRLRDDLEEAQNVAIELYTRSKIEPWEGTPFWLRRAGITGKDNSGIREEKSE